MAIQWPAGATGAVSLSYDDGIPAHFQTAAPQLEAAGLRGTFYVPAAQPVTLYRPQWQQMAARGHELGNHSLFHPCADTKIHTWLNLAYDLLTYNEKRWLDEMGLANDILATVDGRTERTFGNTCWDNFIGLGDTRVNLETLIPKLFFAARGEASPGPVNLDPVNFNNLGTVWADFKKFDELKAQIEGIVSQCGWIIYTFHGVGEGTHNLFIDSGEHEKLCQWLGEQSARIWTAPVIEVARHLRA